MPDVILKNEAQHDKYGVVRVLNADRSINREYRITRAELKALQASANGVPPGLTRKEWESGLAVVFGKAMDVGDIYPSDDGTIRVKFAEREVNGQIIESIAKFEADEWSGTIPNITVDNTAILSDMDKTNHKRFTDRQPTSIINGVLRH